MTSRFHFFLATLAIAFLGLLTPSALRADELVVNGGFESGDLSGWAASGSFLSAQSGYANSGDYSASLGSVDTSYPDSLSQTLTTLAGQTYTVSFWVANGESAAGSADFWVTWDGNQLIELPGDSSFGFTNYTFVVTGTGSDTLNFEAYQLPSYYYLDDVSVDATPEPSSFYLLGTGLVGICGLIRRKLRA